MAISATFIGVNKYSDFDIPDLTGAVRDATALWALFEDSVPGIKAELATNQQATLENVRRLLDEKLALADPDDTVIISFAGHGSRDHRLLFYNTQTAFLEETSLPMSELVERFNASPAKTVLCFLDCCFSGEAPARVFAASPVARDHANPFQQVSGRGRVLIAAANFNEKAYEFPSGGHGLLTDALIKVLQEGEGSLDVQTAIAEVMNRVRAAAAGLGYTQTPVHYGLVEGGLTLPVLKPGKHYAAAFPELGGVSVGADLSELAAFGFPSPILQEWTNRFGGGLNDLQLAAVNEKRILEGKSLFVVAPTSSGKTFVGEMAALKAILKGQKAVFLLPYKALANEKYEQFSRLYGDSLGFRVNRCTGDWLDGTGAFLNGKYDISLLTYEMFLGLATSTPSALNQIGLVVVDEAQFITDPQRGIVVELLLTLLLTAREKNINPQLIILSAVIGNVNSFDEWLGVARLVTEKRPVPLIEGVLDRSGTFQFVSAEGAAKTERLLPFGAVIQRKKTPSSQDVIVPLVKQILAQNPGERIIIFRNARGPAEGCAAYLADELGLAPPVEILEQLPKHDLTSSSLKLRKCLAGGTAFHNTNLFPSEKETVEKVFRDPNAGVKVLASTTTLAAGINTPASTVILAEQEFKGDDGRDFTIAEYKNMAGRAGRLGYSEEGKSIILADTAYSREYLFEKYILGSLEPIRSSFNAGQTETWILRLLGQTGRINRLDVVKLLANTYGGFLAAKNYPEWREQTTKKLNVLLDEFIRLELVEEEMGQVKLTLLGQVCGRSTLAYPSMMRLINLLKGLSVGNLSVKALAAVIQALPELDRINIPMFKTGRKESRKLAATETGWAARAAAEYGQEIVRAFQKNADNFFAYYARCKRTLVLDDWAQGASLESIEQNYTVNAFNAVGYGHVRGIADATRFHLRAAHQIAAVIFIESTADENAIETYLKQLEEGLPEDALGLLEIGGNLGRGEYLALYRAGLKTADEVWASPSEKIAELLGAERTAEIENLRPA